MDGEVHGDGVEERYVRACLTRPIDDAVNRNAHGPDVHLRVACNHLDELDAARCDRREENFGRRQLFAGTAILDGAVHHEVVRPRLAKDPAKNVGGARRDVVFAKSGWWCGHSRESGIGNRESALAKTSGSVELAPGSCLVGLHATRHDFGAEIILAAHGVAEHSPQEVDLSDMRECIGNRALEDLAGVKPQRLR